MFWSYVVLSLGVTERNPAISWAFLDETFAIALHGYGFLIDIAIVGLLSMMLYIFIDVYRFQLAYRKILSPHTGGMEALVSATRDLRTYRILAACCFLILSIGTTVGVVFIILKLMDPSSRGVFFEFYFSEVQHTSIMWVATRLGFTDSYELVGIGILSILSLPLFCTIGLWVGQKSWIIFRAATTRVHDGKGNIELDSLIRDGFFEEIKFALGAKRLAIQRAQDTYARWFGASIEYSGIIRRSFVITVDSKVFLRIQDRRQLEALIWHEVGHERQRSLFESVLASLVFGIWEGQLKNMIVDPFDTETRADLFSAYRMKDAAPLLGALRFLKDSGWGTAPMEPETFLAGTGAILGVTLGLRPLAYWHPSWDIRIAALERLHCDWQV